MNAFSPPSLYSKTSYSTASPSHFDQFPRSPSPSILTRKRRLWPWGWSGIVYSSAQVRQEAGALPVHQQFCLQTAADAVVELSRELIHLCLRRLAWPCCRGRTRADGRTFALARPAGCGPILVPHGLQCLPVLLCWRVGDSGTFTRPLNRNPKGWRQRQPPRRNLCRALRRGGGGGVTAPHSLEESDGFQRKLGPLRGSVEPKLAPPSLERFELELAPAVRWRVGEGGVVPHCHQGNLRQRARVEWFFHDGRAVCGSRSLKHCGWPERPRARERGRHRSLSPCLGWHREPIE